MVFHDIISKKMERRELESTSELKRFSQVPWYEIFQFRGRDYKPQSGEEVAVVWFGSDREEKNKLGLLSLRQKLSWEEAIKLLPLVQPPEPMVDEAGQHYLRNAVALPKGLFSETSETKVAGLIDQMLQPLSEVEQDFPLFKTSSSFGKIGLDFTSLDGKLRLGSIFIYCPSDWRKEKLSYLREFFEKRLTRDSGEIKREIRGRAKELSRLLLPGIGNVLALKGDQELKKRMGEDWPQILGAFDRLDSIMTHLNKAGQGDFSVASYPFGWPQMIVLEESKVD